MSKNEYGYYSFNLPKLYHERKVEVTTRVDAKEEPDKAIVTKQLKVKIPNSKECSNYRY